MKITESIARWVAESAAPQSDLARRRAAEAIRDTVACMVAGAGDEAAASLRRTLSAYGRGAATVIGSHDGAPAPWAAMANGMSAHVLDYDDNFYPGLTHASAVLVPALLALAEERGSTGRQLVDAYLVGLDVQALLGRGVGRAHYDLGWHNTSTTGCIGAAAACARLLGLDARRVTHAISLGVSMASGCKVQFGSPAKPFHAGMAAQHAVLAATLAAGGLEGRLDAIEGSRGFHELYGGQAEVDWAALLAGLGQPTAVELWGLAPKLYPCCGSAHPVLDAVLALRERHGLRAEDVVAVSALVGHGNKRNLCYDDPQQEMEARFSLHYCVALALLYGRLTLADFTNVAVQRKEVRRLLPIVGMRARAAGADGEDPTHHLPHEVELTLRDGSLLRDSVTWPRGTIHQPFTQADIAAKFQDCCEGFLPAEDFRQADAALDRIDTLSHLGELTRHLRFEAGGDCGERFLRRERTLAA